MKYGNTLRLAVISGAFAAALLSGSAKPALAIECMLGEVRWFAGTYAPRNWAFAHGQLLAVSENTKLFSILGTTYGGDARTTFGLPDLRGRHPVGPSQRPGLSDLRLGDRDGFLVSRYDKNKDQYSAGASLVLNPIICIKGIFPGRN